jgi:hypothetical protein
MNGKFKKGDEVIIIGHEKTNSRYGINSDMMDMFISRRPYKVQTCDLSGVEINEYFWHPDDVKQYVPSVFKDLKVEKADKIKPKIFYYDISNLEV